MVNQSYKIDTKQDSEGKALFTVIPDNPRQLRYPIGWFKTPEEAITIEGIEIIGIEEEAIETIYRLIDEVGDELSGDIDKAIAQELTRRGIS